MIFNQAIEVLESWITSVNSQTTEHTCSLYADDASLLPTFSPHTLRDKNAIRAYFEQLNTRKNLSVSLEPDKVRVQELSESQFVLSGIYTFRFEADEQLLSFASRFTFVVDLGKNNPIIHHHSSQVPRTLS